MPLDKQLVFKKLDLLNEYIAAIENMQFDEPMLVDNADIHDLVVFRLQQAVETCIDISTHLIAQSNFPRKETAKDAFLLLGQQKVIDPELAARMGQATDFRNRVVHGYNDFDYSLLFKDYRENLNDLRAFGAQILQYVEQAKNT